MPFSIFFTSFVIIQKVVIVEIEEINNTKKNKYNTTLSLVRNWPPLFIYESKVDH